MSLHLLIDTYSLVFRAFYALPAMSRADGAPTAALYGLSVLLLKLLREHQPTHIAFAVDRGPSFRRELDPAYKSHRPATPSDLAAQLEALPGLFTALETKAHGVKGYEADDVLATLARRLSQRDQTVLVVSGDRDLFQVVGPQVRVLFVGRRGQDHVLYDEAQVRARYGLLPRQLPSFIALTGDKADNISKVPGVGDKTASRWLQAYDTVDGILAHVDGLEPSRLREVVVEYADQIRRASTIAALVDDVDLEEQPLSTSIEPGVVDGLGAWFEHWAFESLKARLPAVRSALAAEGATP